MPKTVFCQKYQKSLPGLEHPPFPGPEGQTIFTTISQQAWQEWLKMQTMLINERNLQLIDPNAQTYLKKQRTKFFNNEVMDHIEGYTPP